MRMSSTVKRVFHFSFSPKRSLSFKGKGVDQTTIDVCYCAEVHDPEMAVSDDSLDLQASSRKKSSSKSRKRTHLVRVVSWASIARGTCRRWTMEQERELRIAEHELARCQKAWSSEQELWLAYIKALEEEKEAHEDFYHNRAKQQDDEQQNFRKAWNRRKSSDIREEQREVMPRSDHRRRLRKSLDRYR
ncbi:hypothetical protein ASPWEDRAFT_170074 [Aspergillus wentii DTO 134E9]|uniref:Uncharacterized protein n=1 Tax=Aspergillus wentii DTO 134E9 TaxID=1073089 RepID=A0A1L9RNU2_ASPWE|nr:uncharacterized protein ASPWEDRAFT_170074 [Aspergillus wentii DTO 134E9]KAI9934300.1 hypothetical protein MW887_005374 [Aspergillus wentii]OJJ36562.1 hypothetical protein ASPWEDRAFT_170074 [Aspergillus wentii DTO 134E9]